MNRSPRFGMILILALLVAIAAGVFLSQQERSMSFDLWPRFELDELASIEITTRKQAFVLVREPSGWVVRIAGADSDALPIPADKSKIEGLIAAIAHNRPTQDLGPLPDADGTSFGFQDPAVTIVLKSASKALHDVQIVLGHETPTGAAIHARCSLSLNNVMLLDANVARQLDRPAEHYFDVRLVDLPSGEAQRVSFTGATGATWTLERNDDTFVFSSPESLRGHTISSSEVRLYLHNLSAFTADSIQTGPVNVPNGKNIFTVEVLPIKSATPLRVEFLPQGDGDLLFGRSSWHPTGFWVDKERARNLFKMAFDMQWRGVLNFDSSRVERAHIFTQQGNQTLTVEKGTTGWLDKDTGRLVQGIDITLWRLKELRIESEPATRLISPSEPRVTLELFGKDVRPLAVYNFYVDPRLPAGQCWLRPGQEEVFYPVGTQIIEDLQGHLPSRAHRPAIASETAVDLRKP